MEWKSVIRQKIQDVRRILFVLSVLLVVFGYGTRVKAVTPEELKNRWHEKMEYPVRFLDDKLLEDEFGHLRPVVSDEWKDMLKEFGAGVVTDILNPPADVLEKMTSKELAALMQKWPWLHLITTYNDSEERYDLFFKYAELNSDIFYELLSREDGYVSLLEEYRKNPFDVKKNNEDPNLILSLDMTEKAEIFGCQFIRYYHSYFTQEEYVLAAEIIEEKLAVYEKLNDETRYWLNLSRIGEPGGEAVDGVRSNYYPSAENRREQIKEDNKKKEEEQTDTEKPAEKLEEVPEIVAVTENTPDPQKDENAKESIAWRRILIVLVVIFVSVGGIIILRKKRFRIIK